MQQTITPTECERILQFGSHVLSNNLCGQVDTTILSKAQIYPPNLIGLRENGHLATALSYEMPTLKNLLYDLLFGRVQPSVLEDMMHSFQNIRERYLANRVMFVHLFEDKGFQDFCRLSCPVSMSTEGVVEESTNLELLYTTDTSFEIKDLPKLQDSAVFAAGAPALNTPFKMQHIYGISSSVRECTPASTAFTLDYLFFIPRKYFIGYK